MRTLRFAAAAVTALATVLMSALVAVANPPVTTSELLSTPPGLSFLWQQGTMLGLSQNAIAYGVNNGGQVVGQAQGFAALWDTGGFHALESSGYVGSTAYSINASGQAVGSVSTSTGFTLPVIWKNGLTTVLPTLGGSQGVARSINGSGQIAGYATTPQGYIHAVLWDSSGVHDLTPAAVYSTYAYGINASGQVTGTANGAGWIWYQGQAAKVAPFALGNPVPRAINDSGQVAGYYFYGALHAFEWSQSGGFHDLGTMTGDQSIAFGINNAGQVVGGSEEVDLTSNTPGTSYVFHAIMWDNGTATDLGVLNNSPFSLAFGVNDSAQVVGVVVPEAPGVLALAAALLGFAGLLVCRRRVAAM